MCRCPACSRIILLSPAEAFRIGKSVKKIRRYLGSDLSSKELEEKKKKVRIQIELRAEAYKRIFDPLLKALSKKELDLFVNMTITFGEPIISFLQDEMAHYNVVNSLPELL